MVHFYSFSLVRIQNQTPNALTLPSVHFKVFSGHKIWFNPFFDPIQKTSVFSQLTDRPDSWLKLSSKAKDLLSDPSEPSNIIVVSSESWLNLSHGYSFHLVFSTNKQSYYLDTGNKWVKQEKGQPRLTPLSRRESPRPSIIYYAALDIRKNWSNYFKRNQSQNALTFSTRKSIR